MGSETPRQDTVSEAPTLSVVIPLYNEEDGVDELLRRVVQACRGCGVSFEVVIVNDGSRDQTMGMLVAASETYPELRIIDLLRNFGPIYALTAGLSVARGDAVMAMDGDLQDPPELIPQFLEKWREGADVVYGLRTARRENFLVRKATAGFHWLLGRLAEVPMPRDAGNFGLMDRRIVDILNHLPERERFFAGLRSWVGGKQTSVTYPRAERGHGASRVGVAGMARIARTALISFSKVPLRYASAFALLCGFVLLCVGLEAVIIRMATNRAIPGWATYTTLIGMTGFVQSALLAILSEYVAVIFDEIKSRPMFLIRSEFSNGKLVGRDRRGTPAVEPVMPPQSKEPTEV